ncbi:MAG: hypothetical protein HY925_05935 [Elusimicrobia bacterium]|nr:hypothetical protein [Elusimicrobiota bacterium]
MLTFALAALLFPASAALAEDRVKLDAPGFSPAEMAANAFLLPLALAFNRPHYGFEERPYQGGDVYGRGERDWAAAVRLSGQSLSGKRAGGHADLQVRAANRLGWQASWDGYADGALREPKRADVYSGHITCNYAQTGHAFFELGLGGAIARNDRTRTGPSGALLVDLFPRAPWTVSLRWQSSMLKSQAFHQVSARTGLAIQGVGVYAGYGALLTPLGDVSGPEAGLAYWF